MNILPMCISVHYMYIKPMGAEEDLGFSVTAVTDDCKPSHQCWDSNSGSQEQQPELITIEPFLQVLWHF